MKNVPFLTVLVVFVLVFALSVTALAARMVYVLPIHGEIEPGLAAFVARGLALAERNHGVVLLEINTFGGRVDAATEIKDLVFRAQVPVIAYVGERAWSAGALIALSAPRIAMAPGSSMGAAEPRPAEERPCLPCGRVRSHCRTLGKRSPLGRCHGGFQCGCGRSRNQAKYLPCLLKMPWNTGWQTLWPGASMKCWNRRATRLRACAA